MQLGQKLSHQLVGAVALHHLIYDLRHLLSESDSPEANAPMASLINRIPPDYDSERGIKLKL